MKDMKEKIKQWEDLSITDIKNLRQKYLAYISMLEGIRDLKRLDPSTEG